MVSRQMEKAFKDAIKKFEDNVNSPVLTNDIKLEAYKYYKQANYGKCNTTQPSMFNLKEAAKWNAWNSIINMSQEEAVQKYITLSFIF
jgi:diazepam-binding inhibitor (GABA receptor modulating acyl-CoA-binding protein)